MKIQTANLSRLLHNQHLTFHREFEALITEKNAETLDVATAFTAYQAAIEAEDAAMMKVVKSAITDEKEAADMRRDELLTGSFELIRVTTKHFDATKCAAAKRLSVLLSTYQGSDKAEYNDETSRIRNYIQELRSEKYTADATAIGLTEWIEPLEEANETCATLADQYNTEQRDKNAAGKVRTLRLETDKAYRALVERINALTLLNGDEKYADLITRWNTRIDAYRNAISRRLGSGAGGSTGSGDNTPTEPTEPEEPEDERPGGL